MMERIDGLFQTETDTEVMLQMIARADGQDMIEKTKKTLAVLGREAAFSLIILHKGRLIAARDPFGFRPLSIGRRGEEGDYEWAVASETCAFRDRFDWIGDVEPGQIVVIDGEEARTITFAQATAQALHPGMSRFRVAGEPGLLAITSMSSGRRSARGSPGTRAARRT